MVGALLASAFGATACGSDGRAEGGLNAPCTRARDCQEGLSCSDGVCTDPDAGLASVVDGGLAPNGDASDGGD